MHDFLLTLLIFPLDISEQGEHSPGQQEAIDGVGDAAPVPRRTHRDAEVADDLLAVVLVILAVFYFQHVVPRGDVGELDFVRAGIHPHLPHQARGTEVGRGTA